MLIDSGGPSKWCQSSRRNGRCPNKTETTLGGAHFTRYTKCKQPVLLRRMCCAILMMSLPGHEVLTKATPLGDSCKRDLSRVPQRNAWLGGGLKRRRSEPHPNWLGSACFATTERHSESERLSTFWGDPDISQAPLGNPDHSVVDHPHLAANDPSQCEV